MPRKTAVSLFSNCGAGDLGYRNAGFNFIVMAELEAKRAEVCGYNHPNAKIIQGDLRDTWVDVVSTYKNQYSKSPELLTACPPCQGLSSARGKRGHFQDADSGSKDDRNLLVTIVCDIVNAIKPKILVLENVPEFLSRKVYHPKNKSTTTAAQILLENVKNKYFVFPVLLDLCDFGIPQYRKRCFITCLRKDCILSYNLLLSAQVTPYPDVNVGADGSSIALTLEAALSQYQLPQLDARSEEMSRVDGYQDMHQVPVWSEDRYAMVKSIPKNSGLSAWKNNKCTKCGCSENNDADVTCCLCGALLPKPLIREKSGKYRLIKGFRTSYKRMAPNKPSATILTASGHIGSHNTIHPFEDRLLSPLECQILQTIPLSFKWGDAVKKYGHSNVRAMIGEAVPPTFTKLHGEVLTNLIEGHLPRNLLPKDDQRIIKAWSKLLV